MTTKAEMKTLDGVRLAQHIRGKVEEFKKTVKGIDESRGNRAPDGRWTPKQIVSHLCGPDGFGVLPPVQAYLEKDTPRIDLVIEDPFYTETRSSMTIEELLALFTEEYGRLAEVVEGLTPEQLQRRARIPVFRETPLGEYPTLGEYLGGMLEYHLGFHTEHLREVLQAAA